MKLCKVKPRASTCRMCLNNQIEADVMNDCSRCMSTAPECELLKIGSGFWIGAYAIVQIDGRIEKVSLSRIYDVREA